MSPSLQTILALALVALSAALLLRSWFAKKKSPGCGSTGECGALSPEVKQLRAKLKG